MLLPSGRSPTSPWAREEDVTGSGILRQDLVMRKSSLTPSPRKSTQKKARMERRRAGLGLCLPGLPGVEIQGRNVSPLLDSVGRGGCAPAWLPAVSSLPQPGAGSRVPCFCLLSGGRGFPEGGPGDRRLLPSLGGPGPASGGACQAAGCRAWNNGWWHQLF